MNIKLDSIKRFLAESQLDFFLQLNSDEFNSEYVSPKDKRIEFLTGFSGSAANLLICQQKAFFFTDGRYLLQAQEQLDIAEFEIIDITKQSIFTWLRCNAKNFSAKKQSSQISPIFLAVDAKLLTASYRKNLEGIRFNEDEKLRLILLEKNPIDEIWQNRPNPKNSEIYQLPLLASGMDSWQKRQKIIEEFSKNADLLLIAKPENLCWLLNIRSNDVENTPLLLSYGILQKNGKILVFANQNRFKQKNSDQITGLEKLPNVEFIDENNIIEHLSLLKQSFSSIQIDESSTNCWIEHELQKLGFAIIFKNCSIESLKIIKNKAEIFGARKAHQIDGVALVKFWKWLEDQLQIEQRNSKKTSNQNSEKILFLNEILIGEQIDKIRSQSPFFIEPSFPTIAGFAKNGAVIHYRANKKTNLEIKGNSILLVDSGGQYLGEDFMATTDITRSFAINKPSKEMIRDYSLVLKGHLALSRLKFPRKSCGAQLDSLARFYLWQFQKDYAHGTGHGVGAFLSVHEGKIGISPKNFNEILPGMILSNEPGFYLEKEYGIRIENLVLVCEFDENFLSFETLSLVPYEASLIDFSMITYPEKMWLRNYHQEIISRLNPFLSYAEQEFLYKKSAPFLTF